jgi:hypothetical protein
MSRAKGTPNVITREVRGILKGFIAGELAALPERIADFTNADRIALMVKLLPYVLPKVDSVHHGSGEPPSPFYADPDVSFG